MLSVLRQPDGSAAVQPAAENARATPDDRATFAQVRTTPQKMEISFAAVVTESSSQAWDLILRGSWMIADPGRFLSSYALSAVSADAPLSRPMAESWLANSLRARVGDAARGKTIAYLRDQDGLPAAWWQKRLDEWMAAGGIRFTVVEAKWESADTARADAERRQREDLQRIAEFRQQQIQAELRETESTAAYKKEKSRLRADMTLSASEQEQRLRKAELDYRRELLEAEQRVEEARRVADRAALEHELTMARLANDVAAETDAKQRRETAQQRQAVVEQRLGRARQAVADLGAAPPELLRELTGHDARKAFQAAERLVSPEFRLPADALAGLGFAVGRQSFTQLLKDRQASDPGQVALAKEELRTRDIGAAKVKALPIGSSLQFSVRSGRDGFFTLLNIGTSGSVYLQAPSAMVRPQASRVVAGRNYLIPGPELFPWPGDYREEGPGGWEHLAVIVSDEILVDDSTLARSSGDMPIVKLSEDELYGIMERLSRLADGAWSAGVLSFLVG